MQGSTPTPNAPRSRAPRYSLPPKYGVAWGHVPAPTGPAPRAPGPAAQRVPGATRLPGPTASPAGPRRGPVTPPGRAPRPHTPPPPPAVPGPPVVAPAAAPCPGAPGRAGGRPDEALPAPALQAFRLWRRARRPRARWRGGHRPAGAPCRRPRPGGHGRRGQ